MVIRQIHVIDDGVVFFVEPARRERSYSLVLLAIDGQKTSMLDRWIGISTRP